MINPFREDPREESTDRELVEGSLQGRKGDLEELVRRHQAWIYNIALRMVWHPQDAEDVTQEVLIKIITKLSSFRRKSSFRTWVYRIVANHVLNMKRRGVEKSMLTFSEYGRSIDASDDMDPPDRDGIPVDLPVIIEETKIHCMMAMLLCLDRRQRLTFILGEIFGVSDRVGSEILETSRANFRKILSRSRKRIYRFMQERCGLIRPGNSCHCGRKVRGLIETGSIDPENLQFNRDYIETVRSASEKKIRRLTDLLDTRCRELFLSHPFQEPPDFVESLREIVSSGEIEDILDYDGIH